MAPTKPLHKDFILPPPALKFACHAFTLAWTRIAFDFAGRPDATHAARDLLARSVLSHIGRPLGEPEVVASRALRTFRDILPVRRKVSKPPYSDPNLRACQETRVLLQHSRATIDGIIARKRETGTLIERALALIAEQQRPATATIVVPLPSRHGM